jgi:hypothetical protein
MKAEKIFRMLEDCYAAQRLVRAGGICDYADDDFGDLDTIAEYFRTTGDLPEEMRNKLAEMWAMV